MSTLTFNSDLITEATKIFEAPEGSVNSNYYLDFVIYEDTAVSTWVAGLDTTTATDLENYLATLYTDETVAFSVYGTGWDENSYYPSESATVLVLETKGAWVSTFST